MSRAFTDKGDRVIMGALVAFALFFRLSTIMMMNTGVDERDYWLSAKAIAQGLPYPELTHRTTRYAIILPTALAQVILGSHPNVYYVMPVLNCMVQAALAYALGLRLRGRLTGFLAALCLILFPYMIRAGSQVRPEVFSITYVLLALYGFVEYLGRERQEMPPLVWTTVWLFIAYEAKITNLFFAPGLFLAILLYKRRPRHAFLFAGILFGLFLAETGLYAIFTKYRFGELEIIMENHFHADSFTVPRLVDLLLRYSPRYLQAYWSIPFAGFAAAAVWYLARGKDRRIDGLVLGAFSFFFFLTIAVKGLHPVTPAEAFINRYFCAVLGPVFLVLSYAIEGALGRLFRGKWAARVLESSRLYPAILALGAIGTLALFAYPRLPAKLRAYAISPLHLETHPFALNERYRREVNEAFLGSTPIVAPAGLAGENAIWTCSAYFIDAGLYRDGRPPAPQILALGEKTYYCLSARRPTGDETMFLVASRRPFRVERMAVSALGELARDDEAETND
jgi:hypothetical protein